MCGGVLDTALVRSWSGVGAESPFVAAASASEPPPFCRCESAGRIFVSAPAGVLDAVIFGGRERQRAAHPLPYVILCHTRQRCLFNSVQRSAHFLTPAMFHVKHRT